MYPNTSPPGNCCSRNNVFDQANGKFIRFPGFSGSHGWQWSKRILNLDSSVWIYDLNKNRWINMLPFPEVSVGPARAVAYDSDNQIILVFNVHEQSKTAVYDLYANIWTLLYPKKEPPPKLSYNPGFSMVYDSSQKLFVLFGIGDGTDPRTFTFDIKKNEWEDTQPKTTPTYYKADPLMVYDNKNKASICIVQNKEKSYLETWAYDTKKNEWTKMNPPKEPTPTQDRQRQLTYAPDQNLIILENRYSPGHYSLNEQQIWTYRFAEAPKDNLPKPPQDLKLKITKNSVRISWKSNAKKFNVYHGIAKKPWLVNYKKIATAKINKFIHKNPEKNKIHYYYVTAVDQKNNESASSLKVRSQPRAIIDVIISPLSKNKIKISWKTEDKDIQGYNIYRAKTCWRDALVWRMNISRTDYGEKLEIASNFKKINKKAIQRNKFIDKIKLNQIYAYRVHALNKLGIESGPSPYILTIPSPPQYIFSKENGNDCKLRWQKNSEKSIIGYNVYRMRDRWDDDPELLNKKPIKNTSYIDKNATENIPREPANYGRRYYITAIDFLGQESFPSAPVWFYREWHKFYKLGVWHQ